MSVSFRLTPGLIGLLALLGACKSSSPYPAPVDAVVSPDHQLCQSSCDVFVGFACPDQGPNCVERCEASLGLGICVAETRALLACGIAAGAAGFVCNDQNKTILRPGVCQNEQSAVIACVRPTDGGG